MTDLANIEKFRDIVQNSDDNFEMRVDDHKIVFVQLKVGTGKYIYSMSTYCSENSENQNMKEVGINNELSLFAIVTEDKAVYLFEIYPLSYRIEAKDLPDQVAYFNEYKDSVKYDEAAKIFERLYSEIEIGESEKQSEIVKCEDECRKIARNTLLNGNSYDVWFFAYLKDCFDRVATLQAQNYANFLCGLESVVTHMTRDVYNNFSYCKSAKIIAERVKEITEKEQKLAVEDWEFEMADALNVIKGTAKTVNVTFHYEGKEYTEKIQLEILMRKLKRKDNFDHWDFLTQNKGDQVMVALGVPKWRGKDGKELLQCKHISKITYGKKVVFQMEM